MTNTIHDNVSALRIRIPVVEQEEDHTITPYEEEYSQEYEGGGSIPLDPLAGYDPYDGYDPFDDLENHYACLDYFELLRQARLQLHSDTEIFDIFSPIPVINDYD